ncbi:hypothetical protein BDU57DRAFT_457463 [Ampelomyces quisqualis]|uniref:Uncharacterized protein n=1 Tax=Ampelomyces quisqualis TaxID=50730 RepID=A0A6A5QFH6_AMPQU|nr:hypothetical protein BDU57DRAFT_457463 [Ampelomyces quisqualis]
MHSPSLSLRAFSFRCSSPSSPSAQSAQSSVAPGPPSTRRLRGAPNRRPAPEPHERSAVPDMASPKRRPAYALLPLPVRL